MSNSTFPEGPARSRRSSWLSAVAVAALVAGGALGTGMLPTTSPARAELLSLEKPVQAAPSFADVVERVKPAVVSVRVKTKRVADAKAAADDGTQPFAMPGLPDDLRDFFKRFGGEDLFKRFGEAPGMERRGMRPPQPPRRFGEAQGSGFFISGDGYLVTNNHVVENAEQVEVVMDDGRRLDGKVVGTDPKTDLALVKVTEGGDVPYVRFAKQKTRIGDWVVAIGNPFGLGGTVTAGIVSAQSRDIGAGPYDDFIQIDAPINRGNSGGPTFNLAGEVVGVNTAIFSPSGGNVGIAFAIPANVTEQVVAQLKKDGFVARGYLGVQIQPLTKDLSEGLGLSTEKGALVASTQDGTPAARAGLKSGDVIVAVNKEPIKDAKELTRTIGAMKPGTKVEVSYLRGGSERTVTVELGSLPNAKVAKAERNSSGDGLPKLGLQLAPAQQTPGAGDEGVAVVEVAPDSPAAEKGIKRGDVILEIAGRTVSKPEDVKASIESAVKEGRKVVLMRIKSGDGVRFVAVPFPKAG